MPDDLVLPQTGGQQFPSTHWSILLELQDPANPKYTETLNSLIEQYWKPAYHYVRALRRVQMTEAMDLTQQFFTMLLSRKDFEKLSPDRGSFRGFLKTALRNFLISADRSKAARLPKGGAKLFGFDPGDVEWMQTAEPTRDDPDAAFDQEWARLVLVESINRLEERLTEKGKLLYYKIFRDYCLEPSGMAITSDTFDPDYEVTNAPTYGELAGRYGINEDAVRNYLRFARREMRVILREEVKRYLDDAADVEQELRFVLST